MIADTSQAEAKKLKEATIQAHVKYEQLKLEVGYLITGVTAHRWTHSEDHIVTLGMRSRSGWREQHAVISKKLIEVEGLAKLHDLTDLQDLITDTKAEIVATSTRMDVTILEIETTDIKQGIFADRSAKTCPINLPTYSGALSEDFITFKDKFNKAAVDNRISRRDRIEKLRECLTGKAAANLPLNGLQDIEEAWKYLEDTFGDPYTSLNYRLARIREIPGLTDKLVQTDPAYAANWFLDYENSVKEVLHLGDRGAELEAVAFSIPTLYAITSKLPFAMGDKVYDIEESGKHKPKKILGLISKARVKASARSTDLTNNTSTGNIISSHLTSPTIPT